MQKELSEVFPELSAYEAMTTLYNNGEATRAQVKHQLDRLMQELCEFVVVLNSHTRSRAESEIIRNRIIKLSKTLL